MSWHLQLGCWDGILQSELCNSVLLLLTFITQGEQQSPSGLKLHIDSTLQQMEKYKASYAQHVKHAYPESYNAVRDAAMVLHVLW